MQAPCKFKSHQSSDPAVSPPTGTFITMDICTKRLLDIGTVEIRQTVRRIRTQRAFSIQMPDQYVFCHLALIEHAQREMMLDGADVARFEESSDESD